MSKITSRGRNQFCRLAFTRRKSRGAPNGLVESLTFGAHTNRVTIPATQRRSCAASTAFSFLMTANVGGSCPFTGSTRAQSTPSQKSTYSQAAPVATDVRRTHSLLSRTCRGLRQLVAAHSAAQCTLSRFVECAPIRQATIDPLAVQNPPGLPRARAARLSELPCHKNVRTTP